MDQPPTLTYDVLVAILTATLGLLRHRRLIRGFALPPHSRGLLADLLLVMPDLDPLARIILPLLPHAWPVQSAATYGRLDVLMYVHDRGLLGTSEAPNKARIQAILAAANAAEHLHILRWLLAQWPAIVQADIWSAQRAIGDACNMSPPERGIALMDFWVYDAGLLEDSASERRQVVLADEAVYKAISLAFGKQNRRLWDWDWVHTAIRAGHCSLVGLCADLEDAGHIQLSTTARPGSRANAAHGIAASAQVLDQHCTQSGLVASELEYDEWIMILATMCCELDEEGNVVSVAKTPRGFTVWKPDAADWWVASGLDLKLPGPHSSVPSVIDLCAFEPALNWWRRRQGMPRFPGRLFPALHDSWNFRAAYWGSTSVYRWWKNVYDKGILPPCSPSAPNPAVHQPYSHSRIVELAAMCPNEWEYDFNLRSVLESSTNAVSFRGSLVEWARQRVLRPENPLPDWGPNIVLRVCGNLGIDPENGGLPPPEGGYVRKGPGEAMVFSW
ncbi:hypothetical protein BCR44DRAFT_1443296 [Catenaria anguillulae PL171]|uniref:Uncharacterized protein n=1 Tax=Catenaria anguillulae PL171 TaxID=765915 RepID=A0A1Y2HD75_9FUNG|nr:hypothetical protein BCR44DRAFT_1443296 [Catenaria anguillulae PL171]